VSGDNSVLTQTAAYVQDELCTDSSGHDWWHIYRVRRLAVLLGEMESADLEVVELSALLHDISDYKLNGGDREKGPRIAYEWLTRVGESKEIASTVANIVAGSSFSSSRTDPEVMSIECKVIQDADRLDALGAIGVARAFAYGGRVGQLMHDPGNIMRLHAMRRESLEVEGATVEHFYSKLLLLKDGMHTEGARLLAARRHDVLERFLNDFLIEWDARDVPQSLRRP
jgi:uncharacterized protein